MENTTKCNIKKTILEMADIVTYKNVIVAILLMAATLSSASAAITSYVTQQELQRNYALLEERYVQLYSHMMMEELADYMIPIEY